MGGGVLIIRLSSRICVAPYYGEVIRGLSGSDVFLANCIINGTILGTVFWYEMCVLILKLVWDFFQPKKNGAKMVS